MIQKAEQLITADELLDMGERASLTELVRGELVEMSPTKGPHGEAAWNISRIVGQFVFENQLGKCFIAEMGFILARDPDTVRAPDFSYVSKTRLPGAKTPAGFFPGAPDLAIEVLSPSDRPDDIEQKTAEYFAGGAKAVWIVDPETREIRVHSDPETSRVLTDDDELTGDEILPGFSCPVSAFFE